MNELFHTGRNRTTNLLRLAATLGLFSLTGPAIAQDTYRLNTGDEISVRIVQWDSIALQFSEFSALSGTYSVGTDGLIMMPIVGAVPAASRSLSDIAETFETELQTRLGLVDKPGVSVSVVEYRPIYVLGAVARPGAYPFSPGLTVQQAMALAGGTMTTLIDGLEGESAAVRTVGNLRELSLDATREAVRAARLRAEMSGASMFTAPEDLSHPDGPEALEKIIAHERDLFVSRREGQNRAIESLENSGALLQTEIAALEEKLVGLTKQVALTRGSVEKAETLQERGLLRSDNLVTLQGQLINLEARELDTETAIYRARQNLSELDRERIALEADRRLEILQQLQQSEAESERLAARRDTNLRLLVGAEAMLATTQGAPDVQMRYRITRQGNSSEESMQVDATARLFPADVLEVEAQLGASGN
ncbi:polysaccharide biosynthesis/export family protein [Salipiger sp. 1_MG-2023]|uniref:polysaccharide biosynthesis/export family protein n=1 Tax=Salipiger sp. 1_MG-2023 TaxID=3062665 RepID=UPI0026E222C6|nr:polysaccharide biosynthesis/export family protein [Salipiger sp. 1_MG-2023]MDO6587030.1 polysaccharide biosynthesis/export family protein [Salipiger sp. 1_MG-2023]